MNKHTPGPWVIIPGGDEWSSGRIATIEPKPETMVETNYWIVAEVNYRRDEHAANAKLIAAAPDLLDALIESRQVIATALKVGAPDWLDTDDKVAQHTTVKKIDAAIAKTTQ